MQPVAECGQAVGASGSQIDHQTSEIVVDEAMTLRRDQSLDQGINVIRIPQGPRGIEFEPDDIGALIDVSPVVRQHMYVKAVHVRFPDDEIVVIRHV